MDQLDLTEWEIRHTPAHDDPAHSHVVQLTHEKYDTQYLSMDTSHELKDWTRKMRPNSRKHAVTSHRNAQFYNSDTDSLSSDASQEEREAAIQARNTLYRQLQQHRKQAESSLQGRRAKKQETSSIDTDGGSEGSERRGMNEFIMYDDGQDYKDMTHLLQRKISMQFKLDSVQKHLLDHNKKKAKENNKTRRFKLLSFKSKPRPLVTKEIKKTTTTEQEQVLTQRVNDLSSRLNGIVMTIAEKKQIMNRQTTSSADSSPKNPSTHSLSPTTTRHTFVTTQQQNRARKQGVTVVNSFGFKPANDTAINTDNLSEKQRERIRAVSEASFRHYSTSGVQKSRSTDALDRRCSSRVFTDDVIHEDTLSTRSETPPVLNRLFSRDVLETDSATALTPTPKSADVLKNNNANTQQSQTSFKRPPKLKFSLSGDSFEKVDTPMKDMLNRRTVVDKSVTVPDKSVTVPKCDTCLQYGSIDNCDSKMAAEAADSSTASESDTTLTGSAISSSAQLHISDFEDYIQARLGSVS